MLFTLTIEGNLAGKPAQLVTLAARMRPLPAEAHDSRTLVEVIANDVAVSMRFHDAISARTKNKPELDGPTGEEDSA